MSEIDLPLPRPEPGNLEYWHGLRRHETLIPRCDVCGTWQWYPGDVCRKCQAFAFTWTHVNPQGKVYTFTTQHHPTGSKFDALIPFTVAVVELTDLPQVRLVGRMIDVEPDAVRVGMDVTGVYLDLSADFTYLLFKPRGHHAPKPSGAPE